MKEYTNPNYIDDTLDEESLHLDRMAFRLAALRQHKRGDLYPVWKLVFAIDVDDNDNGSARVQKDFTSAASLKKLGVWLIEQSSRLESLLDNAVREEEPPISECGSESTGRRVIDDAAPRTEVKKTEQVSVHDAAAGVAGAAASLLREIEQLRTSYQGEIEKLQLKYQEVEDTIRGSKRACDAQTRG